MSVNDIGEEDLLLMRQGSCVQGSCLFVAPVSEVESKVPRPSRVLGAPKPAPFRSPRQPTLHVFLGGTSASDKAELPELQNMYFANRGIDTQAMYTVVEEEKEGKESGHDTA